MLAPSETHATSQVEVAPWDALPPEMKEIIFAALSLLDLGRAAPTSRYFRAAFKARLAVAHPAALQEGRSHCGEAFLRAHSTVILLLSRGMDLFCGSSYNGNRGEVFHIRGDGTLERGWPRDHSTSVVFQSGTFAPTIVIRGGNRRVEHVSYVQQTNFCPKPRVRAPQYPFSNLRCYTAGGYIHIHMLCGTPVCREAAGALAVICKNIEAHSTRPKGRRRGQALKLAVQLEFGKVEFGKVPYNANGVLSEAHLDGIAAALLPLFPFIQVLKFLYLPPGMGRSECSSLGKLQSMLPVWRRARRKS